MAGSENSQELLRRSRLVAEQLQSLTEREFRGQVCDLKERLMRTHGNNPDVAGRGMALAMAAVRHTLGVSLYDCQILCALSLIRGEVAEMRTGEGKTLATAPAAVVLALPGQGVHVVTQNAYLAQRDCAMLSPVFDRLGLSAGLIAEGMSVAEKRASYQCDVTFGPAYEFGFDFLRDEYKRAVLRRSETLGAHFLRTLRHGTDPGAAPMQRGQTVAIVDEIDSGLVDDACSPLIICEGTPQTAPDADALLLAKMQAEQLAESADYEVDRQTGAVHLTEPGFNRVHEELEKIIRLPIVRPWSEYVLQALRAKHLFCRDEHYVVVDHQVQIVDQTTGRIFAERSWRDGLQQAIQLRENLLPTAENQPVAQITRQRFYRAYRHLCGMTGTAIEAADEFQEVYGLRVHRIPLRIASQRITQPDRFFPDADAKAEAVVDEIGRVHESGRPVLVGTRTISDSESLSERLRTRGLEHQLLNGKQDAEEAAIIANAGKRGAVTIATNMAGRGTDIKIAPDVAILGGLHVLGTERHESGRIDRQLLGRCARQGDPGSAQFFQSLDDRVCSALPVRERQRWLHKSRLASRGQRRLARRVSNLQSGLQHKRFQERLALLRRDRRRDSVLALLMGNDLSREGPDALS